MKRIAAFCAASLVGALISAAPAQAVTGKIYFDFRVPHSEFSLADAGIGSSSYSYSKGGVDLKVTAGTASGGAVTSSGEKVTKSLLGLGVKSSPFDLQATVDGAGLSGFRIVKDLNTLVFETSRKVKIHELWFAREDQHFTGDQFQLFDEGASGLQSASGAIQIPEAPGLLSISKYMLTSSLMGDMFGVGATDKDDNWRLAKLSLSVVPGPAPILLLLGAFGALAVTLRGRKAA